MTGDRPSSRDAVVATTLTLLVHGLLGLASVYVLASVVPGYKREFRDYQMDLPYFTTVVIEVSDWFAYYWYVVAFAAIPFLVLDAAIVYLCWQQKGIRIVGLLWVILVILLWLLVAAIVGFSLWLPHLKLLESLSRQ